MQDPIAHMHLAGVVGRLIFAALLSCVDTAHDELN